MLRKKNQSECKLNTVVGANLVFSYLISTIMGKLFKKSPTSQKKHQTNKAQIVCRSNNIL